MTIYLENHFNKDFEVKTGLQRKVVRPQLLCTIKAMGSGGEKESLMGHILPPWILHFYYIKFTIYFIFYYKILTLKIIKVHGNIKWYKNKENINNFHQTALVLCFSGNQHPWTEKCFACMFLLLFLAHLYIQIHSTFFVFNIFVFLSLFLVSLLEYNWLTLFC